MTEPKARKQPNPLTGYLFIAVGVLGIASRSRECSWTTLSVVKMITSVVILAYGLWTVLKAQKRN